MYAQINNKTINHLCHYNMNRECNYKVSLKNFKRLLRNLQITARITFLPHPAVDMSRPFKITKEFSRLPELVFVITVHDGCSLDGEYVRPGYGLSQLSELQS